MTAGEDLIALLAKSGSFGQQAEALMREIDRRSIIYVDDTYAHPTPQDYLAIKNAMLIGASIGMEVTCQ